MFSPYRSAMQNTRRGSGPSLYFSNDDLLHGSMETTVQFVEYTTEEIVAHVRGGLWPVQSRHRRRQMKYKSSGFLQAMHKAH
jgi:hypothetical protein